MSKQQPKNKEPAQQQQPPPEPVIPKNIMKPLHFAPQSKNVGSATFSNIAKQAEAIVSGDNSIVFNNYNNNAVFRSSRVDMNDCVSVDSVNRSIKNVNDINFVDKSTLKGISDGYALNNQGMKILMNDKNIALSTAFSYKLMNELAKTNANIKLESSKREESHNQLQSMIKDLETNEVHDKDMLIKGSLTLTKSLKVDGFGIRTDDINWAALTMNDMDWMSFDYVNGKINMYKPVEINKAVQINNTLNVGKLKITPSDSDNYSMLSLNDEYFMSFNANDDSTVLYKNVNARGNLVAAGQVNANAFETKNYIKFTNDTVSNDYAYIQLKGTEANAGELEIATCDDATEPIYVRQYSGNRTTLKRTLALLNTLGNTQIPGNLHCYGNITCDNIATFKMVHKDADAWGPVADIGFFRICNGKKTNNEAQNFSYIRHTSNNEQNIMTLSSNGIKINKSAMTVIHTTNVHGEIGTFCETTGELSDMWVREDNTDCICQVKTSTSLNPRIVGIICKEDTFASHGDVLVRIVPDNYELGDILVPTENGYGRKATEEEELYMMRKAIPRPKITSLNAPEGFIATFLV